jgi:hypothetical protein
VVCSLLIVTGFYTTPWARIIDQGVLVSSTEPHPIHRIQKSGALTSPIDTKDNQDE